MAPCEGGSEIRTLKDEHETTWFFDKGDPVEPLVKALDKAGFEEIALPRQAILTGEPCMPDPELLERAAAGLSLIDNEQLGKRMRAELVRKAEHQARVFLCAKTLT